jgi:hypothetical protein
MGNFLPGVRGAARAVVGERADAPTGMTTREGFKVVVDDCCKKVAELSTFSSDQFVTKPSIEAQ